MGQSFLFPKVHRMERLGVPSCCAVTGGILDLVNLYQVLSPAAGCRACCRLQGMPAFDASVQTLLFRECCRDSWKGAHGYHVVVTWTQSLRPQQPTHLVPSAKDWVQCRHCETIQVLHLGDRSEPAPIPGPPMPESKLRSEHPGVAPRSV